MSGKNQKVVIGISVGIVVICALAFLPKGRLTVDSGYRPIMGTFARAVAVAPNSVAARRSIEAAFAQLQNIDNLMSDYKDDSEVSQINRLAYQNAVKVSQSTFAVLQRAVYFSELSSGAFDVTVGPLMDLWRSAGEANSVPTQTEIDQVRRKVGYEKLILDANQMSVKFAVDGMRVDLGGIAKGYAIDKAVEAMKNCGAAGGMVDVGGDILCFGAPSGGKRFWLIGLQNPADANELPGTGKPLLILKLADAAVATSGDYRRFVLIDGKKYSHIINTGTGLGSRAVASVTVIADSATDADALATTVSVLGAEKGLAVIEKLPRTEAILIPSASGSELIKTAGADKYLR